MSTKQIVTINDRGMDYYDKNANRPFKDAPLWAVLREAWMADHPQSMNAHYYGGLAIEELLYRNGDLPDSHFEADENARFISAEQYGDLHAGMLIQKLADEHNIDLNFGP